jgi:uncharacterized cupin superfamily protein
MPVSALVARSGQVDYKPGSINPDWIVSGDPQARSAALVASPDGHATANFWDCTAGKFHWHYVWDETVLILGGEVRITDSDGNSSVLRAGDVAYFAAGSSYFWEVERYVRKMAFHRRPATTLRGFLTRYRQRITMTASVLGIALVRTMMRRSGILLIASLTMVSPLLEAI